MLRVIDTGRGIAPDMLPRIFDLFRKSARKSTDPDGGLGLGLAIVKNLDAGARWQRRRAQRRKGPRRVIHDSRAAGDEYGGWRPA